MTTTDAAHRLRRRVEQKVGAFMERHDLWPAHGPLIVAVSGGPDSTALLVILSRLAPRRQIGLQAAHFDHSLRGEAASAAERSFVESLAASLGLSFGGGRADVRGLSRTQRLSLEDAARHARYAFLAGVAAEHGAGHVATGHTASDQAETVLLNLLRGSGLDGLAAMSPDAAWPLPGGAGLHLLRPLLCLTRDETVAYCRAAGVEPLQDESNESADFRRNRVRRELLPLLRGFNPRIDQGLVRLADAARDDASYLEVLARAAVSVRDGTAFVRRDWFTAAPASLRARAVRLALGAVAGDRQGFSARNLADIGKLVLQGQTGDRVDLPRGLRVVLGRDALEFAIAATPAELPDREICLQVPGETRFGDLIVAAGPQPIAADATWVEVNTAAVGEGLTVRRRRPGDRFQPLGLPQEKKLQDFLVDAHVPRDRRDALPLFVSARGIVWVGGVRVAEWARGREGEATVVLSFAPSGRSS
jgi:tRNA(Ile)-lysidine synthase